MRYKELKAMSRKKMNQSQKRKIPNWQKEYFNPKGDEKVNKESKPENGPDVSASQAIRLKQLERQQRFIECFKEVGNLNISQACRMAGIGRLAVYRWMRVDVKFARQMLMIEESVKDDIEGCLVEEAKAKQKDILMFFARTKMRDRGYGEHQSVELGVTERMSQEKIDAIVRAHERVIKENSCIPERVFQHLEQAKAAEKRRLLPDVIDVESMNE
jgi:hypothetical protein